MVFLRWTFVSAQLKNSLPMLRGSGGSTNLGQPSNAIMSELSIRRKPGAVAGALQKGAAAFINSSSFASCSSDLTNDSKLLEGISR